MLQCCTSIKDKLPQIRNCIGKADVLDFPVSGKELVVEDCDRFCAILVRNHDMGLISRICHNCNR